MKVAWIIPTKALRSFESEYHLVLAHQMVGDLDYDEFYQVLGAKGGHYIILDNSFHEEGKAADMDVLLKLGAIIGANEVVIPDTRHKSTETLQQAEIAARWLSSTSGKRAYHAAGEPRLQIVPHIPIHKGDTWKEASDRYERVMVQMLGLFVDDFEITIGVPNHFHFNGILHRIIVDLVAPVASSLEIPIHMLGVPRDYRLGELTQYLRSTDTAKPFAYARAGIELSHKGEPPTYPGRPSDYFTSPLSTGESALARININAMQEAMYQSPPQGPKMDADTVLLLEGE